jgi:hypothetical protein
MEEEKRDNRGGVRPGSGRPAAGEDKRIQRQFRASDAEYEQIKEIAAEEGMRTGEYIRERALKKI